MTFSEKVVKRLTEVGMGQAALGIEVQKYLGGVQQYSQSTVSRWLSGERNPEDDVKRAIEMVLKFEKGELLNAEVFSKQSFSPRFGLTAKEYFEEVDRGLLPYKTARAQSQKCQVWFVGPDALPGLKIRLPWEMWIQNMRKGHDYRFLWILDYLQPLTLGRMSKLLNDFVGPAFLKDQNDHPDVLPKDYGKLYIQGCAFQDKRPETQRRQVEFQRLIKFSEDNKDWCKAEYIPDSPPLADFLEKLQIYTQAWATIICYLPKDMTSDIAPFASVSTDRITTRRDTNASELNFLWFQSDEALNLRRLIDEFRSNHSKLEKEIVTPTQA